MDWQVFETLYPGTWLCSEDEEWAWRVSHLFYYLESDLADAAVSLNLFESARQVRHEQLKAGWLVHEYQARLESIHAHSYLYAVDAFGKMLDVLCRQDHIPEQVRTERERFHQAFPSLRDIRNSALHVEDRARGLDRKRKPIEPKPISNRMIEAPSGGVLVLSGLNVNRIGYTLADGSYAEIALSYKNTATVANVFQNVLNAFQWEGPERHVPHRP